MSSFRRWMIGAVAVVAASIVFWPAVGCRNASSQTASPDTRPVVVIVRGTQPATMVAQAVELLGGMEPMVRGKHSIVIKPNLTMARDDGHNVGQNTDVKVVGAVVDQLQHAAPKAEISIAEGAFQGAFVMFQLLEYDTLAQKTGVKLLDLDAEPRDTVTIDGLGRKQYQLPRITQKCDMLIDVAVLKTHFFAGVTLGMKNLYGLLPMPRMDYHDKLAETICDLNLARRPDLVIIEGLTATEGEGPVGGDLVTMNVMIAGTDVVAVDAVGAAVMGFDPASVPHLRMASEHGMGTIDLSRINIKGAPLSQVQRRFLAPVKRTELQYLPDATTSRPEPAF